MMMTHTILVLLLCISAHFEISYQASPDENACTENTETENHLRHMCNRYRCLLFEPIISKTITCNNISIDSLKLYETSVEDNFDFPYNLTLKVLNSDIPVLPASIFQNIRNITTLFMENVNLETIMPAALTNLDQLKEIYLGRNKLTTISDGIFNTLTMLQTLDVSNNRIETISSHAFRGVNLTNLDLNHNNISSLEHEVINSLKHLSVLNMSYNNFRDVSDFGSFHVATLNLSHNNIRKVDFEVLQNSEYVDLSFNNISKIKNVCLQGTKTIILTNNRISDFDKIDCFDTLNLSYNNIRNLSRDVLGEHLTEFDVSFNFISSLNVDTFFGLYNLTRLYLDHNNLSSLPNSCFKDLRLLTHLNLSYNRFSHFEFGTFDDLLNLKVLDLSSNNIKTLPEVHSLRSLAHLYVENNEISDINIDFIRAHSSTLLYMNLNDNPWPCETLINILRLLKDNVVSVFDGNFRDGTNIRGIKCLDKVQTDSGGITTEPKLNDSKVNSSLSDLYKFFNDDFKRSEIFKYLEGLNKTLNAQNIDYTALNKVLKELISKSSNLNEKNGTLFKYLVNYMQSTNTAEEDKNGKLDDIADSLRVIVKDLEKANKFKEERYNTADFRATNFKYLESLNAVGKYSKDANVNLNGKFINSFENTTETNYTGLLSVIAILLLINICIMVFVVYRKFFYVNAVLLKRDEVELI